MAMLASKGAAKGMFVSALMLLTLHAHNRTFFWLAWAMAPVAPGSSPSSSTASASASHEALNY